MNFSMRYVRLGIRAASLLAYVSTNEIILVVGRKALAAYEARCAIGNRVDNFENQFFAHERILDSKTWAIIIFSILLARSNRMIWINFLAALIILAMAWSALTTASNWPYQCFTQGGTYEDNTSGLGEFEFFAPLLVLSSCVLVTADFLYWILARLLRQSSNRRMG